MKHFFDFIKILISKKQLKLKLENEEGLLERLNVTRTDLSNKIIELTNNEEEMIELKPFTDKLQIFSEFKEEIYKFNQLKNEENSKNYYLFTQTPIFI